MTNDRIIYSPAELRELERGLEKFQLEDEA
jgi:hypothetical protein